MKYYKTEGQLIQYNPETKVYKVRNNIERVDTRIATEDFEKLTKTEVKRNEFSRLMNVFFKDIKHHWVYDNTKFRKLPNFEASGSSLSSNYVLGKDVPYHKIEIMPYVGNVVLVYHWGRIYYHTISYGGYAQGQLINPKTLEFVQWAQLKHCAPVFNIDTKKIC
jgi:hypothetical protein